LPRRRSMNASARRPQCCGCSHASQGGATNRRPGGAFIVELEIFTVKTGRHVARLAAALQLAVVRLEYPTLDLLAAGRVNRVRDVRVQLQAAAVAVTVGMPVAVPIPVAVAVAAAVAISVAVL